MLVTVDTFHLKGWVGGFMSLRRTPENVRIIVEGRRRRGWREGLCLPTTFVNIPTYIHTCIHTCACIWLKPFEVSTWSNSNPGTGKISHWSLGWRNPSALDRSLLAIDIPAPVDLYGTRQFSR